MASFGAFDIARCTSDFSGLCRLLRGFLLSAVGFLLLAAVLALVLMGFDPDLDSSDESALPNVAAVWLE